MKKVDTPAVAALRLCLAHELKASEFHGFQASELMAQIEKHKRDGGGCETRAKSIRTAIRALGFQAD